jgi:type II restriction enzyme
MNKSPNPLPNMFSSQFADKLWTYHTSLVNPEHKKENEQFFTPVAIVDLMSSLYDTANKDLYVDKKVLKELGIPINEHSKMPDVVIYDRDKNWLFLIDAVTSHGTVSPKRVIELEEFLKNCKAGKVYISAIPDDKEFKKHFSNIA